MAGGRNDIEMRITADSRGVASGLAPMLKGLDDAQKAAADTETALEGIGGKPITLSVNDQAIENARGEIARLRDAMRTQLSTDVNADTSEAQRRIRQLQSQIRTLDQADPTIDVTVETSGSGLAGLSAGLTEITSGISGSGGLTAGLGAAARGVAVLGGSSAAAATGIGAGAVAIGGLTLAAADAETQIAQLDALTQGLGEETFGELQKWAASTPFAIEDATEATKKLVAAGVPLEDVPDWLNDIGNTAAATGVPLEQAATVFAQMVSKGKASYEELQQLAESGIPVWGVLADQLGLTVAEVQKMATEGKLGADAIALAREGINDLYPDAMQRQAETFNGQMSTLNDNLSQTGQSLGTLFLPLMTELVGVLNEVAGWLLIGSQKLAEFDEKLRSMTGGTGIFETVVNAIPGIGQMNTAMEGLGDETDITTMSAEDLAAETERLAEIVKAGMDDGTAAAAAFAAEIKEAEAAVNDAVTAFGDLGGEIRTTVSFIINKDDLQEEIDKVIVGVPAIPELKDKDGKIIQSAVDAIPPVTLPAHLNITQIAGLGDKQQDLISSIASFAEEGLAEGARRATLNPNFDGEAWLRQVRRETRGMLVDAGVDTKDVDRVLTNVFGLPRTVPVSADIAGAQADLDALGEPIGVPLTPYVPQEAADSAKRTPGWLSLTAGATAGVTPEVVDPATATTALDDVAADRTAEVMVSLDALSLAAAQQALNLLTMTETKTIRVVVEDEAGAGLSSPGTVGTVLGPPVPGSGGGGGKGGKDGDPTTPRRIAPRQSPVAVYLDGVEIAKRIEGRRAAAASTSVRRAP